MLVTTGDQAGAGIVAYRDICQDTELREAAIGPWWENFRVSAVCQAQNNTAAHKQKHG